MASLSERSASALIVVDLQDSFLAPIGEKEGVLRRSRFLIEIARLLQVPIIATEQYASRMGERTPRSPKSSAIRQKRTNFAFRTAEVTNSGRYGNLSGKPGCDRRDRDPHLRQSNRTRPANPRLRSLRLRGRHRRPNERTRGCAKAPPTRRRRPSPTPSPSPTSGSERPERRSSSRLSRS